MDSERFDTLTRMLSSRRTALAGLLGGLVGLPGLPGLAVPEEAGAHTFTARCRKIPDPAKRRACLRRACLRRARAHKRNRHSCKPKPLAVTCAKRCGRTQNNCKKGVTCTCPTGRFCHTNKSCSRLCTAGADPGECPAGCGCGVPVVEGGSFHCVSTAIGSCLNIPQVCTSTAQCPFGQFCGAVADSCEGTNRCVAACGV